MLTQPVSIAVSDPSGCFSAETAALAAELQLMGLTLCAHPQPAGLELCFTPDGLMLRGQKRESIIIDFASDTFLYRIEKGGGRRQPLARAIGLKPGYSPLVLDATAGLGRDGFILASLGCRVILCERSAIIHALLRDGLARAAADPRLSAIANRITLHQGDALTLLPTFTPADRPEVIYLDPMFPHRTKNALVKKEMRMVRTVVGDDSDTGNLLREALVHAGKRVVCKRPSQAAPIEGPRPDFAITTPKHRFDIYLPRPQAVQQE